MDEKSNSTRNILLLSPLPPPHGGIAVWTKKILEKGLPKGFFSIKTIDTKITGNRNIFETAKWSIAEITRTFRIISSLLYHIVSNKPHIVHINSSLSSMGIFRDWLCGIIAKMFNIPIVAHFHGNLGDFPRHRFAGFSYYALCSLIKTAKINIVINGFSLANIYEIQENNIQFLPNFVEDDVFNLAKHPTDHPRPRAIFAGGITRAKGCEEIYQLALTLPEVDFYLIGKMHADMKDLYHLSPRNIFLKGEMSHSSLLHELCSSDFLLFPSYSEGFPLTVIEAMAIGLPVIATRVGAIPELIEEGVGGILVAPGDIAALTNAIKFITNNVSLRHQMGKFNREQCFKYYRYSIVIQQLINIYEEVLDKKKCVA